MLVENKKIKIYWKHSQYSNSFNLKTICEENNIIFIVLWL